MRKPPTHRILYSVVLLLFMLVQWTASVYARYLDLTVLSPKPHDLYYLGQDLHIEYAPLNNTIDQLNIYLDTFGKVTERIFVKLVADISKHPSGTVEIDGQQVPKYSYTYNIPTSLPVNDEAFQITFETAKGDVLIPILIQRPPLGPSGVAYQNGSNKPTATAPSTSLLPTANTASLFSRPVNGSPIPSSRSKRVITIRKTIVITTARAKPTALSSNLSPMPTYYQSHPQPPSSAAASTFILPTHLSYNPSSPPASHTVIATNNYNATSKPYQSVPATSTVASFVQPTSYSAQSSPSALQSTFSSVQPVPSTSSSLIYTSNSETSNISTHASTTGTTAQALESSSTITSTMQETASSTSPFPSSSLVTSKQASSSTIESSTVTMSASTTPTPPDKDSFIRHPSAASTPKLQNSLSVSITILMTLLLTILLL